jgi:hypothetical protein
MTDDDDSNFSITYPSDPGADTLDKIYDSIADREQAAINEWKARNLEKSPAA